MSEERAKQLAMILRAIEDLEREKGTYIADWKARRENLENAASKLSDEILSGQLTLATEPPEAA